jgi:hypothetical protein
MYTICFSEVSGLQEGCVQTFEMERHITAPRAVAWAVLSDLDGWGEHAPNLSKTEVVEGQAEGAVRRCYNNAGKAWNETCSLWEAGGGTSWR